MSERCGDCGAVMSGPMAYLSWEARWYGWACPKCISEQRPDPKGIRGHADDFRSVPGVSLRDAAERIRHPFTHDPNRKGGSW